MSREKKKEAASKKITRFPSWESDLDMFQDEEMDDFLRESLKEEADEEERRLNADPSLTGVGVSGDLYQKIVAELKERGEWEEDEVEQAEMSVGEDDLKELGKNTAKAGGSEDADEEVVRINGLKVRDENAARANSLTEHDRDAVETGVSQGQGMDTAGRDGKEQNFGQQQKEKAEYWSRVENEKLIGINKGKKAEIGSQKVESRKEESESQSREVESRKKESESQSQEMENQKKGSESQEMGIWEQKVENSVQESGRSDDEVVLDKEELYKILSEEDREALELGYEVRKKEIVRQKKRKKRQKIVMRAGTVVAAMMAVFGVSMTSGANRRLLLNVWDAVIENLNAKVLVDYAGENDVYKVNEKEKEAREAIVNQLGIAPIEFLYLPDGMEFSFYQLDQGSNSAVMYYSYGDILFNVSMKKYLNEEVLYYQIDESSEEIEIVTGRQNQQIELHKIDEESYAAVFTKNEIQYYLLGAIPHDQIKKICEFLVVLEN